MFELEDTIKSPPVQEKEENMMEKESAEIRVCGKNEEIFLLSGEGSVTHLLPDEACTVPSGSRELSFQRRAKIWLPVGAGGIRDRTGKNWGGFCTALCTLKMPRRFVIGNRRRLILGDSPEGILAEKMRNVLKKQMESRISQPGWTGSEESRRSLWDEVRKGFEDELRGTGWEIISVRPQKLERTGGGA